MKTQTKLLLVIVFIIIASNSFLGYINIKDSEKVATEILTEKNYNELLNISEYYFNKLIEDMEYIVTTWSEDKDILSYNKDPNTEKIVNFVPDDFTMITEKWGGLTTSLKDVTWIYYAIETDGSIYISPVDESMPSDYDARTREWYQGTIDQRGDIYWTDPYIDAGDSGKLLQTVSRAVYENGVLKGVVGLDIELNKFTEIINNLSFSKGSLLFLVNQDEEILAHNTTNLNYYQSMFIDNLDLSTQSKLLTVENEDYLVAWVPLNINKWRLVAITKTNYEATLRKSTNRMIIIVSIIVVIGIIFSVILSSNIMKPLQDIVLVTKKIASSNFDERLEINSKDEFLTLATSFNHMLDNIEGLIKERDDNYIETVKLLANAIEASDKYTRGHCDRVGRIAMEIANEMNLPDDKKSDLEFACILHDVGKIGIPENILNKPGFLTEDEFTIIKEHPFIGYEIVKEIEFLKKPAEIILQHHERIDGQGYPYKLTGNNIKIEAKILAVADVYDAMTSYRIYRQKPLTSSLVKKELLNSRGSQLDADVVDVVLHLIESEKIAI